MTTAVDLDAACARAMLNRYVGRDISQWVDDDDHAMDLVVQDVLSQWHREDDLAALWTRYANSVDPTGQPQRVPRRFRRGRRPGGLLPSGLGRTCHGASFY